MPWLYGLGGFLAGLSVMGLRHAPRCVLFHTYGKWTITEKCRYDDGRKALREERQCRHCGGTQMRRRDEAFHHYRNRWH